jgi:hypothetical protein
MADAPKAAPDSEDSARQAAWSELFALSVDAARPSRKWCDAARGCVERISRGEFDATARAWFTVVSAPGAVEHLPNGRIRIPINGTNSDALKALVWACGALDDEALAGAIGDLAVRCFTKIPAYGALSMKVGNACIHALCQLPGMRAVAQLSRLSARVRYRQAQGLIEKAKLACAKRAGMDPIDLEELAVPTFGLPARVAIGSHTAELAIDGVRAELVFYAGDRRLKSVPAEVKQDCAAELRELRAAYKELAALLPALRARLERWMLEPRRWTLRDLRARYLDHPVVGSLARRLIYATGAVSVVFGEAGAVDAAGDRVGLTDDAMIELWHPLGRPIEEVRAWRERIEALGITQPFKQAHREIYVLTDAERQTETYSNRFASHVLRQHQFAALCRERGWAYTLQGQWDSHNTPRRRLAAYGLDAEFLVDASGDAEVTGAAVYVHATTDQVRFCRDDGAVRLADVPPRCFSELMRDVDLFVGVCSVATDPAWRDHGPADTHAYWTHYAFGELGETGETRRAALERLLPKLKIRDRVRIDGRFVVVQGQLRTYKIHLGSGNILMEPNGQYLCIVSGRPPGERGNAAFAPGVRLPFEGDSMLSLILSKLVMLAADDKIKDPTIVRQIIGPN